MKLFDVHTHMQDLRIENERDDIVRRSRNSGVLGIMSCGVHEGDWERLTRVTNQYKDVLPSYGLHPWFVSERSERWLEKLEHLIENSSAGIGETGLDNMVSPALFQEQLDVFVAHLRLAGKYQRPVSIHCRKAWGKLLETLRAEGGLPYGGVIHSYSGSADMVPLFEELGAHISFSGSVTKSNNKKARKAVLAVSRDRLLLETDSPDILPEGCPEGLNEPSYIRRVLTEVAGLRGESEIDVAEYTWNNSVELFGFG